MTKDKDGVKPEEQTPEGTDQPVIKPEEIKTPEEIKGEKVDSLKKQLAEEGVDVDKIVGDNDNYKTALLVKKADDFTLEEEVETPAVEPTVPVEAPEGDEWKKDVDKMVTDGVQKGLEAKTKTERKSNEKVAIRKFVKDHPEVNKLEFDAIKDEYTPKHGTSVDGILEDLSRAYKYVNIDKEKPTPTPTNANVPAGTGAPAGTKSDYSEREMEIINDHLDGNIELFKQFKEQVLTGKRNVPESVYNLLNSQ